eukprot:3490786-Amphidinium_carterae.1
MAALPTVPLAAPGEPAQEAASSAYSNEDWHRSPSKNPQPPGMGNSGVVRMRRPTPPGEKTYAKDGRQANTLLRKLGLSSARNASCGNTTRTTPTELGVPARERRRKAATSALKAINGTSPALKASTGRPGKASRPHQPKVRAGGSERGS